MEAVIRKMKKTDIEPCADILCRVYNNEMWRCRWSKEIAMDYLTDFFDMKKYGGTTVRSL